MKRPGKKSADDKELSKTKGRRGLLKSLVIGGGAIGAAKIIPDNWVKPVVESVILPSHAQTSEVVLGPGGNPLGRFRSGTRTVDASPVDSEQLIADESMSEELLEFFMPSARASFTTCPPGNCSVEFNMEVDNVSTVVCVSGDTFGLAVLDTILTANPATLGGGPKSLGGGLLINGGRFGGTNWVIEIENGSNVTTDIVMTPGGMGCGRSEDNGSIDTF